MSRTLPKKTNPLILSDASPAYEELLSRRRLGKTNLSVKPGLIGSSNATKPENLGVFEYAHLRAPLPKDLKGSEIFPSHSPAQHPETYFLMRRSKDGFVSATGMFKIAFPWAKTDEEKIEREYLKSREYTSQEEVAGNVWISPPFALELAEEYKMYDWVRALLDPTEIVQSPSTSKKQITPPPRFDLPEDDRALAQRRSRRSVSPSKKTTSPRKSRKAGSAKDAPSTPSTAAANNSLQEALSMTATMESDELPVFEMEEIEVKTTESPKKKGRKSKRAAEAEEEKEEEEKETEAKKEEKEAKKEEKKAEKKKKAAAKEKETEVEVNETTEATPKGKTSLTTISDDMPVSLADIPSPSVKDMLAEAKEMVASATKGQSEGSSSAKMTKKRKPEEDDEETAAESAQRVKKAKVLEDKLKRERVRNRALFGVSAAFALAASIPYFF
ncbi:uncharacterized protein N7443_000434 [Penicillium atrosanguineum]|uniref:Cell pattern formation-associated protein stuA n=1 Tax=Penicillium atrosanguineum TaxID=1132637 RepID=A0A9W9UCS3_9EURO|nr:uncharacterized protein N7443_000434 [Penicillium atrosanguineum]KAJ5313550.1 hypothetical protein N7443_000434 [Penicillium atrosanguineum]KAJ5330724.1 hypothetical protein N7476_000507 [Penicillium atrosanguineum]